MTDRLLALILGALSCGLVGFIGGFIVGAGGLWLALGMVRPC